MNRYALVIGISEYRNSSFSALPKTVSDAESVACLLEQYGEFQEVQRFPRRWVEQRNCYEMAANEVRGEELSQILRNFLANKATRSDALIYFTGHGTTLLDNMGQKTGYLVTSDFTSQEPQRGIALSSFNKVVSEANLSSLVVMLDCCHAGALLDREMIQESLSAFSDKDYYLIAACRSFESAYVDKESSVFSGAVIRGLRDGKPDERGRITCERLFEHISNELENSGQEPLRISSGRAINLVTRPISKPLPNLDEPLAVNRNNPYQGLQAFGEDQSDYFFGRENATEELLEKLNEGRFLLVRGVSGRGKSSLVRAGLLPELKRDRLPNSSQWIIETISPGSAPVEQITRVLNHHQSNKHYLLFIDQFEELFTLCQNEEERKIFINMMVNEVTMANSQSYIVAAMRSDFIDQCVDYPELEELIDHTLPTPCIVKLLSFAELSEAIERPAAKQGVTFERRLLDQIRDDVRDQPGALPLLQFALTELWRICVTESSNPQPVLTYTAYKQIGGVEGALNNRAERLYSCLSESDQTFVRELFKEIVQIGEGETITRRPAKRERLEEIADSLEQFRRVTRLLSGEQQRLIVMDEKTIEVAHESLLSGWKDLCNWIKEDRESIRIKQKLEEFCQEWQNRFKQSDAALLTGEWLGIIVSWNENRQPRLSAVEKEYLQKSVDKRDRQQRERERLLEENLQKEQRLRQQERKFWERATLAVFLLLSLLPPFQKFLLDWRVAAQASYRDFTGQIPSSGAFPPVALVQIDDESIDKDERLKDTNPIDRSYLADLVDRLSQAENQIIAFDYQLDQLYQPEQEKKLQASLENAVKGNKTLFVFAAFLPSEGNDNAEIGINKNSSLAKNLNWSFQGFTNSEEQYVMLPFWNESCAEICPFSYLLSLAAVSLSDQKTAPLLQPRLNSTEDFRSQFVSDLSNARLENKKIQFLNQLSFNPLATIIYSNLNQPVLRPIIDYSIPSDAIYDRISAQTLLDEDSSSPNIKRLPQQVVMIGAGGYKEAGLRQFDGDDSPLPQAMAYWRQKLDNKNSFDRLTGSEINAYTVHHLLTRRLVTPVPNLWMVMLGATLGKLALVSLERRQITWTRKQQTRYALGLLGATGLYGLISLQFYISGAILLPFVLPSLLFWVYILPTLRKETDG